MSQNKLFNTVQMRTPDSNTFDLSHDVKQSLKMGMLVPFMMQETLPGDLWKVQTAQLLRLAPMLAPIMHRVDVYTHHFFVPLRNLWDGYEEFFTGGRTGTVERVFPTCHIGFQAGGSIDITPQSLGNYLGLPEYDDGQPQISVSAVPIAAYLKIYDDYYRDANLTNEYFVPLVDGDNSTNYSRFYAGSPLRRAWEHDYFTSAQPWAQRGEEVTIPLGGEALVTYQADGESARVLDTDGNFVDGQAALYTEPQDGVLTHGQNGEAVSIDNSRFLRVDLSSATGITVTEFRRTIILQQWLERSSVIGPRIVEYLKGHWGVTSSDKTLQRAQYLGGGKSPVSISEVLQTSETDQTALGQQAGHGIAVGKDHSFRRFIEEHGVIISIMSILPRTAYQQGLPRYYSKAFRFDFADPSFANIGEQAILNKELYLDPADGLDNEVFGYIPRYSEYKYAPNRVAGEMVGNLSFWHMGRIFGQRPLLNQTFIDCTPTTRIFPILDGSFDTVYAHIMISAYVTRKLPFYGTPQL